MEQPCTRLKLLSTLVTQYFMKLLVKVI